MECFVLFRYHFITTRFLRQCYTPCPLVSLCKEYLNTGTERNILHEHPWLTLKICMIRECWAKGAHAECFVPSRYYFQHEVNLVSTVHGSSYVIRCNNILHVILGQDKTFHMNNLSSHSRYAWVESNEPRLLMWNVSLCSGITSKRLVFGRSKRALVRRHVGVPFTLNSAQWSYQTSINHLSRWAKQYALCSPEGGKRVYVPYSRTQNGYRIHVKIDLGHTSIWELKTSYRNKTSSWHTETDEIPATKHSVPIGTGWHQCTAMLELCYT